LVIIEFGRRIFDNKSVERDGRKGKGIERNEKFWWGKGIPLFLIGK
jgi:hypothetical protein